MRTILVLAVDTTVALFLFVAGTIALGALHGPTWLVPLSMFPFLSWMCYRGAFGKQFFPFVIWSVIGFTLLSFAFSTGLL